MRFTLPTLRSKSRGGSTDKLAAERPTHVEVVGAGDVELGEKSEGGGGSVDNFLKHFSKSKSMKNSMSSSNRSNGSIKSLRGMALGESEEGIKTLSRMKSLARPDKDKVTYVVQTEDESKAHVSGRLDVTVMRATGLPGE